MWQRNLLFVGLLVGGLVLLGSNLLPPRSPRALTRYDASAYREPEFRAAVDRVDSSFRREWEKKNLQPAALAPDLTVARRLSLGLMGTVPSVEEIRQFESLPEDERMPWWIDRVLQDRRYADYLGERLARAYVGTENGPFIFYRRRRFVTWLADKLANGVAYDQLSRELITSTGLWTDHPATNFVTVTNKQDNQNQPDPIRLAGRVTRAFLGIRLDCVECHDSYLGKNYKGEEWLQRDFHGLAAFFGQAQLGFTGIRDGEGEFKAKMRRTDEEPTTIEPRVPFASELLPDHGSRRERLAAWVTHPRNPFFARAIVNRAWALMLGRPLVDPVDNLETPGPIPPALQLLADDFIANGHDLRRLFRVIASTEVFRLDSATDRKIGGAEEKNWAVFPLTRLRPEQVVGGVIQSSSVTTIDSESHILVRLIRFGQESDFVRRYGDSGEDEFGGRGGTIPQRLLLMNGNLTQERIKEGLFSASSQIAMMAPDDRRAVEIAYLAVLTRRPAPEESAHFEKALAEREGTRAQQLEDLFWVLINSTEFSWNH